MKNEFVIPRYILATKNIRFLNFIIDIFLINILRIIIYSVSALIPYKNGSLLDLLISYDRLQSLLFFSLLMFIYYSLLEILFSKTISKYITNTIVVMKDGTKPNHLNILGRSLLRLVPFEYLTFLQGRKLGLHDENSSTFVVIQSKLERCMNEFYEIKEIESK